MLPRLAMKPLKACVNEPASNGRVTSMWTALLAIQVNNAQYLFSSDLLFYHEWSKHIYPKMGK